MMLLCRTRLLIAINEIEYGYSEIVDNYLSGYMELADILCHLANALRFVLW